jgi:hypothetical protein
LNKLFTPPKPPETFTSNSTKLYHQRMSEPREVPVQVPAYPAQSYAGHALQHGSYLIHTSQPPGMAMYDIATSPGTPESLASLASSRRGSHTVHSFPLPMASAQPTAAFTGQVIMQHQHQLSQSSMSYVTPGASFTLVPSAAGPTYHSATSSPHFGSPAQSHPQPRAASHPGSNAAPAKKNAPVTPPAAILLKATDLEEARFVVSHACFAVPKGLRKLTTRHYRDAEQLVVFVAVGDIVCARAVVASDVLPRAIAARNIPLVERELPPHWTNVFRVTNALCFDDRAHQLAIPVPLSERGELPTSVEAGSAVPKLWNNTLHQFVDATVALANNKTGHYAELLRLIESSDPAGGIPEGITALVSPVKMVSHGSGIVMLGYLARYFGIAGREFVASALFDLHAGVIDLCRQAMGAVLISHLVRHGTSIAPRTLQVVPWKIMATRVLSDTVGSQTALLMLNSAAHFHRTTRHVSEPVVSTSLTHRVLIKNLADAADPSLECSLSSIAANAQSCRVLQVLVEASVELLAAHAAGTVEVSEDTLSHCQKMVFACCDLADKHAADVWSNYATQSLIMACQLKVEDTPEQVARGRFFDKILLRILQAIRPHLMRLSANKCGSNVVEKLCSVRPVVTTEVAIALLEIPNAFPTLAADRYGNYVIQTLLLHLPRTVETQVRKALLPVLERLDPHWQSTVAIDTWCRGVQDRHRRGSAQFTPNVLPTVGHSLSESHDSTLEP